MQEEGKWIREQAAKLNIWLTPAMLEQLGIYCGLLQEWNEQFNLTSITDTEAIYELHFLDSLSLALAADMEGPLRLLDVGSGAGFPGLVLAIAFPQLQVSLLESIMKKTQFLRQVAAELGLDAVKVLRERAEVLGHEPHMREQFDLVVARAVAPLATLAEYCLPFVEPGAFFVAQKGPQGREEVRAATPAMGLLGAALDRVYDWQLPGGDRRLLISIKKESPSPAQYPRRVGIPAKRPLL